MKNSKLIQFLISIHTTNFTMKKHFYLLLIFVSINSVSQIRVACIGNSITYGAGIPNRDSLSYPAQLGRLLGAKWQVENFGVSGATLLTNGNKPYRKQTKFVEAIQFDPNVVIIKLGTNDSKPKNWKYKDEFVANYISLIDTLQSLPSHPIIFVCYPVPAYGTAYNISDSIITADIIPYVKQVAKKRKLKVIDLYKALSNHSDLFPDKIHPNSFGAGLIAETVSKELILNEKKILKNKK